MSIQGSINQALSIGAALYTQTPKYAVMKEEALNNKAIEVGEANYTKLEDKIAKLDKDIAEADNADFVEGAEAVKDTLKKNQAKIQDDLLKRGSEKALTRKGTEAIEGEQNAPLVEGPGLKAAKANRAAENKKNFKKAQMAQILKSKNNSLGISLSDLNLDEKQLKALEKQI